MGDMWSAFPDAQQAPAAVTAGPDMWSAFPDAAPKPQQADDGFMSRMGRDIDKRTQMVNDVDAATARGEQTGAEGFIQKLGKGGAGIINDLAGETLTSGFRALPDAIENPIRRGASGVADYLSNSMAGDAARWAGDKYKDLSKEYPRAARNIEAVTDIGALLAAQRVAGSQSVDNAVTSGAKTLSNSAGNLIRADEAIPPTAVKSLAQRAAEAKAQAKQLYESQKNIEFSPEEVSGLRENVAKLRPMSDLAQRDFNRSAASGHIKDILDSTQGSPMTFEGALSKRASINDDWVAAMSAGRSNEARQLANLKDALDQTMVNPATGQWQEANKAFGIASTKQDFSNMVERAETMAQPANSLDKMIGNYLTSWRGRTLSPAEKQALEKITNKSFSRELRKSVGNRLMSAMATGVGASVGGVPGAVIGDFVGTYASKFSRDMAMMDKMAGLDDFFNQLDMRASSIKPAAMDISKELGAVKP